MEWKSIFPVLFWECSKNSPMSNAIWILLFNVSDTLILYMSPLLSCICCKNTDFFFSSRCIKLVSWFHSQLLMAFALTNYWRSYLHAVEEYLNLIAPYTVYKILSLCRWMNPMQFHFLPNWEKVAARNCSSGLSALIPVLLCKPWQTQQW